MQVQTLQAHFYPHSLQLTLGVIIDTFKLQLHWKTWCYSAWYLLVHLVLEGCPKVVLVLFAFVSSFIPFHSPRPCIKAFIAHFYFAKGCVAPVAMMATEFVSTMLAVSQCLPRTMMFTKSATTHWNSYLTWSLVATELQNVFPELPPAVIKETLIYHWANAN